METREGFSLACFRFRFESAKHLKLGSVKLISLPTLTLTENHEKTGLAIRPADARILLACAMPQVRD